MSGDPRRQPVHDRRIGLAFPVGVIVRAGVVCPDLDPVARIGQPVEDGLSPLHQDGEGHLVGMFEEGHGLSAGRHGELDAGRCRQPLDPGAGRQHCDGGTIRLVRRDHLDVLAGDAKVHRARSFVELRTVFESDVQERADRFVGPDDAAGRMEQDRLGEGDPDRVPLHRLGRIDQGGVGAAPP